MNVLRHGRTVEHLAGIVGIDAVGDVDDHLAIELRRERADHLIHLVSRNRQDHELRVLDRVSVR